MRTIAITRLLYILLIALLSASAALAQTSSQTCSLAGEYTDCNKTDPPSLAIRVVTGRVVEETGDPEKKARPINGACISLFTEKDHKLVASIIADDKGHFIFDAIKPGLYRLVVRDPQNTSSAANRRVQVYPRGQGPVPKSLGLVAHLRLAGTGDCGTISRE